VPSGEALKHNRGPFCGIVGPVYLFGLSSVSLCVTDASALA
jgi:hypothetical protein